MAKARASPASPSDTSPVPAMTRHLAAAALALGLALPAAAQYDYEDETADDAQVSELPPGTFRKAPVRLVYDHVTRAFTLYNASGDATDTWARGDGPALAEVPTDRPVVLEVQNANALVYDYDLSATVAQRREEPVSCGGQGRQFLLAGITTLGTTLTGSAPDITSTSVGAILGFDLDTVGAQIGARSVSPMGAGEIVQAVAEAQRAQAELAALTARMGALRASASADLRRAALRGDTAPIGPLLDAIQATLEAEVEGLSDPARVPLAVADLAPEAESAFTRLFAAEAAIEAGTADPELGEDFMDDVSTLAESVRATAEALAAEAAGLQDLAITLADAEEATRQRVLLRPDYNLREVAIEITEDSEIDGVRGTRAGTIRAFIEPARRRSFGCSLIVSLAFSPPVPEYGVSFGGTVADESGEGLATSPALLFELAPPVLGDVLGAVGGIGLGRDFSPDLYAGASFRLFDPILVTGGAVWRRFDQLPDGVSLGDDLDATPFADPFELEEAFERGWTRSFFVGLSINP